MPRNDLKRIFLSEKLRLSDLYLKLKPVSLCHTKQSTGRHGPCAQGSGGVRTLFPQGRWHAPLLVVL